jgi:hypothetical protein
MCTLAQPQTPAPPLLPRSLARIVDTHRFRFSQVPSPHSKRRISFCLSSNSTYHAGRGEGIELLCPPPPLSSLSSPRLPLALVLPCLKFLREPSVCRFIVCLSYTLVSLFPPFLIRPCIQSPSSSSHREGDSLIVFVPTPPHALCPSSTYTLSLPPSVPPSPRYSYSLLLPAACPLHRSPCPLL